MTTMVLCYPGEKRLTREHLSHRGLKLNGVRPIAVHIESSHPDALQVARYCKSSTVGEVFLNGVRV